MIGYKAFNSDWTCRGFQYEVGKSYELGENETLKICECGFHFCANPIDVFGYYNDSENTKIAKVEAYGDILQVGTKFVTDKIRILGEIDIKTIQKMVDAVASQNYGMWNTGIRNVGHNNSGDFNHGDYNSGSWNTGDYNSGDWNTSDYNSGDWNTGTSNAGSLNTGYYNHGNRNTGSLNTGSWNTGDYNSGCFNTGHYNLSDYNTGCFNTDIPKMRIFNKECDLTCDEFINSIDYEFADLLYRIHEKDLSEKDCEHIIELPNFDPEIFKEITGIDIYEEMRRFDNDRE